MRAKFSSIESTSQFLQEQKKADLSFESTKKQDIEDLTDLTKTYPKSVISSLGGGIMQEMSMKTDDSYDDDYSFRGPRR